jgi:acyl-homoserine lactone acylase PvdQ
VSPRHAKLYRDRYGVPHAVAPTREAAYFGLGYAAGQDRGESLMAHQDWLQGRLKRRIGDLPLPDRRLAFLDPLAQWPGRSLPGGGGIAVRTVGEADAWSLSCGYWELAYAGLSDLSERSEAAVQAFTAGVNHWLRRYSGQTAAYEAATELAWWAAFEHIISATLFHNSNAFAMQYPASHGQITVLGCDPHYWIGEGHGEAHLVATDEDFNLAGVWDGHANLGFWGGTNGRIAVAVTASGIEAATLYREQLTDDRSCYFDARRQRYVPLTHGCRDHGARRTHHGPLVWEGTEDHKPVAYALFSPLVTAVGRNLDQHFAIWDCQSAPEFVATVNRYEFVRGHRVVVDCQGNIGYASNGPAYDRPADIGWEGIVDGTDPRCELEPLPTAAGNVVCAVLNPSGRFIQSANDAPWYATIPDEATARLVRDPYRGAWRELGPRGARQRQLLVESPLADPFADALAIVFDTYVPVAHLGLRALRKAAPAAPAGISGDARRLDEILGEWDGRADTDSYAMTAAAVFHYLSDDGWLAPNVLPSKGQWRGLELGEPLVSNQAHERYWPTLERAAEWMRKTYGTITKAWGDVHVIDVNGKLIGAPGGVRSLESLFGSSPGWGAEQSYFDSEGRIRCNFGSRVVRVVVAEDGQLSMWSVSLTGQCPTADGWTNWHDKTQTELYVTKTLKAVPLSVSSVIAQAHPSDHERCVHKDLEVVAEDAIDRLLPAAGRSAAAGPRRQPVVPW